LRGLGQLAKLSQRIRLLLLCRQLIGEVGEDTSCQGDVPRLDVDASRRSECLNDRQQGIGGESRSFIGDGVDYGRGLGHGESLFFLQQLRDQLSLWGTFRGGAL